MSKLESPQSSHCHLLEDRPPSSSRMKEWERGKAICCICIQISAALASKLYIAAAAKHPSNCSVNLKQGITMYLHRTRSILRRTEHVCARTKALMMMVECRLRMADSKCQNTVARHQEWEGRGGHGMPYGIFQREVVCELCKNASDQCLISSQVRKAPGGALIAAYHCQGCNVAELNANTCTDSGACAGCDMYMASEA